MKPAPAPSLGLVLTIAGAARELGLSQTRIRRLIDKGLLPARRLGGHTIILRRELDRFLEALPAITTVDGALARAGQRDLADGRATEDLAR